MQKSLTGCSAKLFAGLFGSTPLAMMLSMLSTAPLLDLADAVVAFPFWAAVVVFELFVYTTEL